MVSPTWKNWRARMASRVESSTSLGSWRRRWKEAVAEPGPYLLNVKVTPFECVYPMVAAGSGLEEMVLGPPQPAAVPAE